MVILLAIKVPTGKQIPQRNNACGVEHEVLALRWQIEGLDVNEGLVSRCDGREIGGDVELVDPFFIWRRLLAHEPLQRRHPQIHATLRDGRLQPLRGLSAVSAKGHVILACMIKDARQLHGVALVLQFLHRAADEGDERRVNMHVLGRRAFGRPVIHLRAAVRELRDGDVALLRGSQGLRKAQLWPKGVVSSCWPERLPTLRGLEAATEAVFEGDLCIVTRSRAEFLLEGTLALHVAMSGEDKEFY